MFCSRILVAFDESELAMKSLEKAIELAKTDQTIENRTTPFCTVASQF